MLAIIRALILALFSFEVAFCFRLQSRHTYSLKDSHEVPVAWSRVGSAHPGILITLQIGLKQSRFDELEKQLHEVSTPSHERYGKHVTPAEVNKLVKPSGDALSDVHDWLESHGVDRAQLSYSSAKERIKAQLPVSDIERLLDTQYFICEHEDGTQLVRAAAWSLSSHLHEHIETMQPTNSFFRPKPHRRSLNIVQPDIGIREEPCLHQKKVLKVSKDVTLAQVCNPTTVTPICLRTLYGTIDYVPGMPGKDKVALNNYLRLVMRNRSDKLATAIGVSTRLASALWDRAELEEPISVDEFENHLRAAECHPALTALASLCDLERVLGTRKNGT